MIILDVMENKKNVKKKNNMNDEKMKNNKKGIKNSDLKNDSNNVKKNINSKTKNNLKNENNNNTFKKNMKVNEQEQLNLNENEVNNINLKSKDAKVIHKEKKNKIVNVILLVFGIAVLFGLVFFASTTRDSKQSINYVEDITASKYFELKEGNEPAIILLASPSCSWCQKYKPVITKVSGDYELPVYYLNTGALSQDDYNNVYLSSPSISASGQGLIPTPTTLLVKGGEEVDYISGYVEYNDVVNFLINNGVIN